MFLFILKILKFVISVINEFLHKNGAFRIYMLACHGIFSNGGIERINNSNFFKVIVTNTLSSCCAKRKYVCF